MVSQNKYYSFFIFIILVGVFTYCFIKREQLRQFYYVDFVLDDLNADKNAKPDFLKKLELNENLPEPEYYQPSDILLPNYRSDENSVITDCWADFSKVVVIDANKAASNQLIKSIETTIDSINKNDLKYVNIEIKYDEKKLSYQTFIDILDLFEKKDTKIYGLHKNVIFWINRN